MVPRFGGSHCPPSDRAGDKVAALGGYLELAAVFPGETVTLLIEPGLNITARDEPADSDSTTPE
jgi:hypothetical protein